MPQILWLIVALALILLAVWWLKFRSKKDPAPDKKPNAGDDVFRFMIVRPPRPAASTGRIAAAAGQASDEIPTSIVRGVNVIGVGDLKIVRQELLRYDAAEIAHVENVMASEARERNHTQTVREEVTEREETEQEATTEKELSSTERFELQKEVQQAVQTQLKTSGDVHTTISYGVVTVNANAAFAYDEAKQTASRVASQYAKEVVDRSSQKVRERVLRTRESRWFREVVEENRHTFDNRQDSSHRIGIYRWLEKVLEMKLVNYGQRLLIEVIVPEPARRYLQSKRTPEEIEGAKLRTEEPLPPHATRPASYPSNPDLAGQVLYTAAEISPDNYVAWAAEYQVENLTLPPTKTSVAARLEAPSVSAHYQSLAKELAVPEGYRAVRWRYAVWALIHPHDKVDAEMSLVANGTHRTLQLESPDPLKDWLRWVGTGSWRELDDDVGCIGTLQVSVIGELTAGYVAHVEFELEPTAEGHRQWQVAVYEAIVAAYRQQLSDHHARLNRLATATVTRLELAPSSTLRRIEADELKRSAITILQQQQLGEMDYVDDAGLIRDEAFQQLPAGARLSQFFEQAFEWDNLAYSFYPYFWANLDHWEGMLVKKSGDVFFERFMHAGFARVLLPVRPDYAQLVADYLFSWPRPENPWQPDPPDLEGEQKKLYEAIGEELKAAARDDQEIVEDEWLLRLPTDLVYLQDGRSLAGRLP